jgi:hypothetical protein
LSKSLFNLIESNLFWLLSIRNVFELIPWLLLLFKSLDEYTLYVTSLVLFESFNAENADYDDDDERDKSFDCKLIVWFIILLILLWLVEVVVVVVVCS